jgi:hypothetical protein
MTGYTEVTVIVEGAVDGTTNFGPNDKSLMEAFIEAIERDAKEDGLRTEVYVQYHGHSLRVEDCVCAQYEQDGRPTYSWNVG